MNPEPMYCSEFCNRDHGDCAMCRALADPQSLDPVGYYERKAATRWAGMAHVLALAVMLVAGAAVGWLVSWLLRVH